MKLIENLHFNNIRGDITGGITAGVVALPFAIAMGLASGAGAIALCCLIWWYGRTGFWSNGPNDGSDGTDCH